MSANKRVIETYMEGFRTSNHSMILSTLTEDVEWYMPGFIDIKGKEAFDKEIENDLFEGLPTIDIHRMTEENDVVVAEGSVQSKFKSGEMLDALFCDVFEMENGKIKKLITYQVNR